MSHWRSVNQLVTALAIGSLSADQWFQGWTIPPKLPEVLNDFARFLEPAADKHGAIQIGKAPFLFPNSRSLIETFVKSHPVFLEWNNIGDPPEITFVSRYDPPHTERQHMDLDAVIQNACNWLRKEDEAIQKTDLAVAAHDPDWPVFEPEEL